MTRLSDRDIQDLMLALQEVRDEIFPFVSDLTIERTVLAHASDSARPSMDALVSDMLEQSLR